MSTKATNPPPTLHSVQHALEELRSHLVDLEAVAHAAEDALQHVPYAPRMPSAGTDPDTMYSDAQLGMGRLQALVVATASAARLVLQETDGLIDCVYEVRALTRGTGGNGNGSGSSRAGEDWRPLLLHGSAALPATSGRRAV